MTALLEFFGKPAEAPAAVPSSVHENEPCHRASIHQSMRGAHPDGDREAIGRLVSHDRRVANVTDVVLDALSARDVDAFRSATLPSTASSRG